MMSSTSVPILEHLDDPVRLESLYRDDPEGFRRSLDDTTEDSLVLRVWRARLDFDRRPETRTMGKMLAAIGLAAITGLLVRLPAVWLDEEWYYLRFAPMLVMLAVAAYFRPGVPGALAGIGLAIVSGAYLSFIPSGADSTTMALIHLPIVFWAYVGLVFLGGEWRNSHARLRFVRYSGELAVLTSLLLFGGIVLSGVTVALFSLIGEDIGEWYFRNVAIFGLAAIPIVATYLYDIVFARRIAIAEVLARVFAPLFLVMVIAYLVYTLVDGRNPFEDRSFLITINGLVLLVLGISAFSLLARGSEPRARPADYVSLALVAVTLLMDLLALSAIAFRLTSYGFTPNRVAVLGVNVIVFAHLIWIATACARVVRDGPARRVIERIIGNYLPIYVGWAVFVVFLMPLLFGFA